MIIVFFIMIILISVVLSVAVLWYNEIKIIRNASDSVVSFYAADSGIEKVLYYDRKVIPADGTATRGLCQMCATSSPSCIINDTDATLDCLSCSETPNAPNGCNVDTCDNCTVSFFTSFLNGVAPGSYSYDTQAVITPNITPGYLGSMSVNATGLFSGVSRAINIFTLGSKE